jgi:ABC-type sugar transport system ATPase subunit
VLGIAFAISTDNAPTRTANAWDVRNAFIKIENKSWGELYIGRHVGPYTLGSIISTINSTSAALGIGNGLQITLPEFDAPVARMSGGQRQAVAVARAVAFSSKVVILDEPTAALGLRESARVLDLVRRLKADGVAVILISHSMDHVMAVADRAIVLRRGRAVGEAAPTAENHERLVAWIVGAGGQAA